MTVLKDVRNGFELISKGVTPVSRHCWIIKAWPGFSAGMVGALVVLTEKDGAADMVVVTGEVVVGNATQVSKRHVPLSPVVVVQDDPLGLLAAVKH